MALARPVSFRAWGIPRVPGLAAEADELWREGGAPAGLGRTGARSPEDRLGWVELPRLAGAGIPGYRRLREELVLEGFSRVVVLAMGGSALAAETLVTGLPPELEDRGRALPVEVLSTLAPESVREFLRPRRLLRSVFVVASKSGATVETLALESVVAGRLAEYGGSARRQMIAITDPGSGLATRSAATHRTWFAGIPAVGGRFSALSPFGLLPAVLAGREVDQGLGAAARALAELEDAAPLPAGETGSDAEIPDAGYRLGVVLAHLAKQGRPTVWLSAAPRFAAVLVWLEQMLSECAGKQGRGFLPVILPPEPHPAPGDGVFRIHLGPERYEAEEREAAVAAGVPWISLPVLPVELPAAIFRLQVAVAVAAWRLGVNPYDQPDVEAAKAEARRIMEDPESVSGPSPVSDADIREFVDGARDESLVINAFGRQSRAAEGEIHMLRRQLAHRTGRLPALGFGSQLLHSLGQVEKGGPPALRVLMLRWASGGPDPPIPGRTPELGLGQLAALQAAADYQELRRRGRRVLWLDAPRPGDPGIEALLDRIRRAVFG